MSARNLGWRDPSKDVPRFGVGGLAPKLLSSFGLLRLSYRNGLCERLLTKELSVRGV